MLAKKTVKNETDPPKNADEVRAKLAKLEINEADVAAAADWARKTANIAAERFCPKPR